MHACWPSPSFSSSTLLPSFLFLILTFSSLSPLLKHRAQAVQKALSFAALGMGGAMFGVQRARALEGGSGGMSLIDPGKYKIRRICARLLTHTC